MAARGPTREHPQGRRATRRACRRADQADGERAADSRGRAHTTNSTVPTGLLHFVQAYIRYLIIPYTICIDKSAVG